MIGKNTLRPVLASALLFFLGVAGCATFDSLTLPSSSPSTVVEATPPRIEQPASRPPLGPPRDGATAAPSGPPRDGPPRTTGARPPGPVGDGPPRPAQDAPGARPATPAPPRPPVASESPPGSLPSPGTAAQPPRTSPRPRPA